MSRSSGSSQPSSGKESSGEDSPIRGNEQKSFVQLNTGDGRPPVFPSMQKDILEQQVSRWFAWNSETRWDYSKTEDHVFAAYNYDGGKRIGDMTREELIHVIAMGYHEKDRLAAALCKLADAGCPLGEVDLASLQLWSIVGNARMIVHLANESERMGEIMPAKATVEAEAE